MTHRSILIAVTAVLVACVGGTPPAGAGDRSARDLVVTFDRVADVPALEARVLTQINLLRRAQRLAPLRANPALAAAAREQSLSMAEHGFFGHESFGGSPFWKRVESKYTRLPTDASWRVGENLVWRSPRISARGAVELWLGSPPHRENLLRQAWREVGISAVHASAAPGVYAGHDVTILTVDFGVRR